MPTMPILRSGSRGKYTLLVFCLALGLIASQGCARSQPMHSGANSSVASTQPLPFHPEKQHGSNSEPSVPASAANPGLAKGVPFRPISDRAVLPAGTLLTVQLESSLLATRVRPGDNFTATVADPLLVNGNTLIERGSKVTGRVEAAESRTGSGYVRLTLSTLTVDGAPVTLQTSSLFARGSSRQFNASARNVSSRQSGGVRVRKGRRLTFRLTAPLTLAQSPTLDGHKTLGTE